MLLVGLVNDDILACRVIFGAGNGMCKAAVNSLAKSVAPVVARSLFGYVLLMFGCVWVHSPTLSIRMRELAIWPGAILIVETLF